MYRDRLIRFGFELIEIMCVFKKLATHLNGGSILKYKHKNFDKKGMILCQEKDHLYNIM